MVLKYFLIHNGTIQEFNNSIGFLRFMEENAVKFESADFDIIYGNRAHYEKGRKKGVDSIEPGN